MKKIFLIGVSLMFFLQFSWAQGKVEMDSVSYDWEIKYGFAYLKVVYPKKIYENTQVLNFVKEFLINSEMEKKYGKKALMAKDIKDLAQIRWFYLKKDVEETYKVSINPDDSLFIGEAGNATTIKVEHPFENVWNVVVWNDVAIGGVAHYSSESCNMFIGNKKINKLEDVFPAVAPVKTVILNNFKKQQGVPLNKDLSTREFLMRDKDFLELCDNATFCINREGMYVVLGDGMYNHPYSVTVPLKEIYPYIHADYQRFFK